ncbi:MAG: hypothetical protein HC899_00110 [Leptolyngbyaceae cyanobacterium SM1_4_3]|nr:hypothetical protein [Leptolyngbyaceae cyanobacterium SM1_4_3]
MKKKETFILKSNRLNHQKLCQLIQRAAYQRQRLSKKESRVLSSHDRDRPKQHRQATLCKRYIL